MSDQPYFFDESEALRVSNLVLCMWKSEPQMEIIPDGGWKQFKDSFPTHTELCEYVGGLEKGTLRSRAILQWNIQIAEAWFERVCYWRNVNIENNGNDLDEAKGFMTILHRILTDKVNSRKQIKTVFDGLYGDEPVPKEVYKLMLGKVSARKL